MWVELKVVFCWEFSMGVGVVKGVCYGLILVD